MKTSHFFRYINIKKVKNIEFYAKYRYTIFDILCKQGVSDLTSKDCNNAYSYLSLFSSCSFIFYG